MNQIKRAGIILLSMTIPFVIGGGIWAMAQTPAGSLRQIEASIVADPEQAIKGIDAGMSRWTSSELPAALLIRGKAKMALAKKAPAGEAANKLYLQAGVDFMRVAALMPYAQEATEALALAGRCCSAAGDETGAKAINDLLVKRSSGEATSASQTGM